MMRTVKRVLWVEDNETALNDSIRSLFDDVEKKSLDSLHKAVDEISSNRLYEYDTIVLDIDFRDDHSSNFPYVIRKLKEKIYLKKDQCQMNADGEYAYIKENGGYLLFLYLLERGYPSNRIAFLTGNQDIINKLKIYTMMNKEELSREEIYKLFRKKWAEAEGDYYDFEAEITSMYNLEIEFREMDFLMECEEVLENGDRGKLTEEEVTDKLLKLIKSVNIATYESVNDNPSEYENDMIFRFHKANLESPKYFTKHEDDISEHNLEDARDWLNSNRTSDKILRWLALNSARYVEDQWRDEDRNMTLQVRELLYLPDEDDDPTYDFGVRNAFRQLFSIYDGLKAADNSDLPGINYQAVFALLIPYEANVINHGSHDSDLRMRRNFAYAAKKARNYCAHNYWGSALKDKSALFIMMITMTSILDRDQREREHIKTWYWRAAGEIIGDETVPAQADESRIDSLIEQLWNASPCKISSKCEERSNVSSSKPLSEYTPRNYVDVLGWHTSMKKNAQQREKYYIFSLAVYIVKVFGDLSDEEIIHTYGLGVKLIHDISKLIVNSYE